MSKHHLEEAVKFGELGFPIFPCKPDKRPLTANGFKAATTDLEKITEWWTKHPEAPIGMPTGAVSGLVVVDVDIGPKKDGSVAHGDTSLAELFREHGAFPPTVTAQTPRGGTHYYFVHPEGSKIKCSTSELGQDIDVRGDGGYVVVPPSITSAGTYAWTSSTENYAEMPSWLLERTQVTVDGPQKKAVNKSNSTSGKAKGSAPLHSPEVATTVEEIKDALQFVSADCSRDEWLAIGMALHYELGDKGREIWRDWSLNAPGRYVEADFGRDWESFDEAHDNPKTKRSLFDMARTGGWPGWNPRTKSRAKAVHQADEGKGSLPDWHTWGDLLATDFPTPPAVVDGLLRRGEVSVFSGETKSCKSWFALDLGLSVACGSPWMERQCHRGRVILVNLELPEWAIKKRLLEIAAKRGLNPTPDSILVWNLKGRTVYAHRIREHIQNANLSDVALVIVDPVYRLLGDADENSARDINALLGQIAGVAVDTGAHVILPAHFAKGSPAAKDPQDRASGSGVFARFPDSLLVMTKHENHEEGNGVYTVQSVLRTFPPAPSFVVRWRHPVFEVDSALDPSRLKQRKPGMQEQYSRELLLALLDGGPLTNKEWGMAADEAMRMPRKTFFDYVRRLEQSGAVGRTGDGKYCLPTR